MAKRGENIYKRKDGRYEGRYVLGKKPDGKTKFGYVYGKRYLDVKNKLNEIKSTVRNQPCTGVGVCGDGTLETWITEWLHVYVRSQVKQSSFMVYLRNASNHIIPLLGAIPLAQIHEADISGFVEALWKKDLSRLTVQSIIRLLYSSLEAAKEQGFLEQVPSRILKKIKPAPKKKARYLTRSEQKRIEIEAEKRNFLEIPLSLYTGLRLGEICALRWEDISFSDSRILVAHTLQRVETPQDSKKTSLVLGSPKSESGRRSIPMLDRLQKALSRLYHQKKAAPSDYVFGKGNKPADPRTIQARTERLCRDLGIKDVHFHTFRHTFATRYLELNADLETLRELLGHSSMAITSIYCHSTEEQKASAIARLSQLAE